ncbi:MAG TPA: ABC transporter permease [Streptosporangiaceae bacterium]|nr:ABC transporter permease [Streptosporangiaceae bacterium]
MAAGEIVSDTGSAPPAVGRGYRHWLASYLAMLRFDIASQRTWLPMFVLTQVLFGAGMAVIYGFYLGPMAPQEALFIVSGAPAIAAIAAAVIGVSSMVTERKVAGTWDFIWSLPVPRSAVVASTLTVYTAMTIPGVVATLALAAWRYDVHLSLSPVAALDFVLAALMATSMGFGLALAIRDPLVTNAVLNALIFLVLLFSPVVYPITQLPGWLAGAHRVLPFYYLAQVMRAGVTTGLVHGLGTAYAVLAAWTVAAWAASAWVIGRRR